MKRIKYMTKVMPIRMLNKIYATNNFLNISGRLNACQILAVVQSMLLSLKALVSAKNMDPSSGHHRKNFCGFRVSVCIAILVYLNGDKSHVVVPEAPTWGVWPSGPKSRGSPILLQTCVPGPTSPKAGSNLNSLRGPLWPLAQSVPILCRIWLWLLGLLQTPSCLAI